MRSLALVIPASLILVASIHGQALTEHAAAAAGAAIGTGAGKSLSNSMTKIFGDTDKQTAKAAQPEGKNKPEAKKTPSVTNPAPDPVTAKSKPSPTRSVDAPLAPLAPSGSHYASQSRSREPRKPVHPDETATALIHAASAPSVTASIPMAQPIIKVPTVEEIANIKVGTTEDQLLAALGQPASRLSIPDDDGHLRETCQYWANGRQIGTIRLDNGQVVTVETRPEN
ncbi:MAG TPA: hypothetical protein VNV82_06905 [Bryobacteraceae bacterium]|nr:hypothetical protein [Bryobacteraceae bacterium]